MNYYSISLDFLRKITSDDINNVLCSLRNSENKNGMLLLDEEGRIWNSYSLDVIKDKQLRDIFLWWKEGMNRHLDKIKKIDTNKFPQTEDVNIDEFIKVAYLCPDGSGKIVVKDTFDCPYTSDCLKDIIRSKKIKVIDAKEASCQLNNSTINIDIDIIDSKIINSEISGITN